MARLELLQPHNGGKPGDIVEEPGGVASVLILNRIAKLDAEGSATATTTKAKKASSSRAPK